MTLRSLGLAVVLGTGVVSAATAAVDLVPDHPAGWSYPLVPRATADAGVGRAELPDHLNPAPASTFWNAAGRNDGDSATASSFLGWLLLDGEQVASTVWDAVPAAAPYRIVNGGPVQVPGGRHCLVVEHDATELIPESNESNNGYGRQFVWTPPRLESGTVTEITAPPLPTAGWSGVTDGELWYDCNAVRIDARTGWWNVVAVWSTDAAADVDCRLHDIVTGPADGLTTYRAWSARGAGLLDAVLVNRNLDGADAWDVGIIGNGTSAPVNVYHAASGEMARGDSLGIDLAAGQPVLLLELAVPAGETGPTSIALACDPAAGPLTVRWFPGTTTYASLSGGTTDAATTDRHGRVRLDVRIREAGYSAILISREPDTGLPACRVSLEVGDRPADLAPWQPDGWYSPLVPRPTPDGRATAVAAPDTLYATPQATYLNLAAQNLSIASSPIPTRVYRDGYLVAFTDWPRLLGPARVSYNGDRPFTLPAGRHVLALRCDAFHRIEETDEDNNVWGEAWVWAPRPWAPGTVRILPPPPGAISGWHDVTDDELLWYSCDAMRLPNSGGFWRAVAVMPSSDGDIDVRLHEVGHGAKDGFAGNLCVSSWGVGQSDYVLVNTLVTEPRAFDVGFVNVNGTTDTYVAQAVTATTLPDTTDTFGPFSLTDQQVVAMYEIRLAPGTSTLALHPISGNAHLGLSLHANTQAFQTKNSAIAAAWLGDASTDRQVTVGVPAAGWYCIAVWKVTAGDLLPCRFELRLDAAARDTEPVDSAAGARAGVVSVQPNPCNPQTVVTFDLARSGRVQLDVFDVRGRRVARLVDGDLTAGRHEVTWRGRDDDGRRVSSGIYVARLTAPAVQSLAKIVVVD